MRHKDLFSGIGGFALAARMVWGENQKPRLFCEKDQYARRVLNKNFPGVPCVEDIRDLRGEPNETTDLVTAGFPCQPFSVAGKRTGKEDDRYLWPETLRFLQEDQPRWFLGENVPGIISLALDEVLASLESAGYETETLIIPACAVNAPHRRDRVWIIAYDASKFDREDHSESMQRQIQQFGISFSSSTVADADSQRLQTQRKQGRIQEKERKACSGIERRGLLGENGIQKDGSLNPEWIEWLMGYPEGWTDLEDSETQ